MAQGRTVIRGGYVMTMDPAIGDLARCDVLVENGIIAAVAPQLEAEGAEVIDAVGQIVMPGMIDTHRHTWQTQMRAITADWVLSDYTFGIRLSVSPAYSADDVYIGNKLGALEALNAGVTTILDFSHCNNTPDHSDAAVKGLLDAGVRAVFGYGYFESNMFAPPYFKEFDERVQDFHRIMDTYFSSAERGLLSPGVALTEIGTRPFSTTVKEVQVARERGAIIVTHTGCVWSHPAGVREMDEAGILGADQVHVHCNTLDEDEWRMLARAGAKVSISPETELNMGMGRPVFAQCERHGIKPTLSCDVISLNSGDLLTQLRLGLAFKRWADTEGMNLESRDPARVSTRAREALEWVTVNGADAIGQGGRIGCLSPGKQADVIVIGGPEVSQHPVLDPAGTVVFQTTTHDVRTVLVAGDVVKRDGVLESVDLPALLNAAEESAAGILARVHSATPDLPPTPEGGLSIFADMVASNLKAR